MLPEDAILLPEIVDAIFLVASHPASQGQHEEMQSVGYGRRLHGSDTAVTHVVSGIHAPRPFSRTIRGPSLCRRRELLFVDAFEIDDAAPVEPPDTGPDFLEQILVVRDEEHRSFVALECHVQRVDRF